MNRFIQVYVSNRNMHDLFTFWKESDSPFANENLFDDENHYFVRIAEC